MARYFHRTSLLARSATRQRGRVKYPTSNDGRSIVPVYLLGIHWSVWTDGVSTSIDIAASRIGRRSDVVNRLARLGYVIDHDSSDRDLLRTAKVHEHLTVKNLAVELLERI